MGDLARKGDARQIPSIFTAKNQPDSDGDEREVHAAFSFATLGCGIV